MGYDVIGDIHGHAAKLEALLLRLGYVRKGAGFVPPHGRQAVFLGDFIDRGPEQVAVTRIVRAMIDGGHARAVMGNHEFNAIGYVTPRDGTPGQFLRRHSAKNTGQHAEFLRQVGEGSALHRELVAWFRTLPPALDLGAIRAVHAWWHNPHVELVRDRIAPGQPMDDQFLQAAYAKGSAEWDAMEGLTKGLEIPLPAGHSFVDHGGVERRHVRTRWWLGDARSFRDIALVGAAQDHRVPDLPVPADFAPPPVTGAPVFVGHYWLTGTPAPQTPLVACLDYSAGKDGPLVAYRWDGERTLDAGRFVAAG